MRHTIRRISDAGLESISYDKTGIFVTIQQREKIQNQKDCEIFTNSDARKTS